MRVSFTDVFEERPDGALTPRRAVRVVEVQFGPGIIFSKGVLFAGIDFTLFKGKYLEVEENNGILEIKGIYQ